MTVGSQFISLTLWAKGLLCINHLVLHQNSMRQALLLLPFFSQSTERLNNLPKVTQLSQRRGWIKA